MRVIDLETWHRRDHYQYFCKYDYPHFSICADLNITEFLSMIKSLKISFTASMMYLIARTANAIPEFRHRVRDGNPIEHDVVHPGSTILTKNELFAFCTVEYMSDFKEFIRITEEEISRMKTNPSLEEKFPGDDVLYLTSIPWVSFTGFMHPLKLSPPDSVPRFAWGKFRQQGERVVMPLSVQAHHAVVDGLHAGRFYTQIQDYLDHPESFIDEI